MCKASKSKNVRLFAAPIAIPAVKAEAMWLIISLETPGAAGTFLAVISTVHLSEVPEIVYS